MENTFRNSVFGGFNRQDVMEYITKTAAETGEQLRALEEERDALAQAAQERDMLRQQLEELRRQEEELRRQLQSASEDQARLRGAEQEKIQLAGRVQTLERQAEEYRELKEHIAQIELDAHKRADELVAEAERQADELVAQARWQAEEIRRQLREQLGAVAGQYDAVQSDLSAVREHVVGELRKMDVAMGQLPLAFDRFGADLARLRERAADLPQGEE